MRCMGDSLYRMLFITFIYSFFHLIYEDTHYILWWKTDYGKNYSFYAPKTQNLL